MVIEACRAMLTERFRLMCKQRGRQHTAPDQSVTSQSHSGCDGTGPGPQNVDLHCRLVTVDCHSGAQSVFATAHEPHLGGMPHLLTAPSKWNTSMGTLA